MKVAAVQMDLAWEDRGANFAQARQWSEKAAAEGADLIVLPEMFATGFSMNPAVTAEAPDGPTPRFLQALARDLGRTVVGGYVRQAARDKGINTALAVGPDGRILAAYGKTHLISILGEDAAHEAGAGPVSFDVGPARCACFICYDLRFPELFRLVADDHHLVLVMASWPDARQRHWDILLQARAIENQLYVTGVNRVGRGGGLDFAGGSAIVDPLGRILAHGGDQAGLVIADVEPSLVAEVRRNLPFLQDRRF